MVLGGIPSLKSFRNIFFLLLGFCTLLAVIFYREKLHGITFRISNSDIANGQSSRDQINISTLLSESVSSYGLKFGGRKTDIHQKAYPSIEGTAITMEEIRSKTKNWIHQSIKKNPKCADVHKNSESYWRSVSPGLNTMDKDFERMNLASNCGAFDDERLMALSPGESLLTWERDYLSQPAFTNMADTTWASLSELVYVNSSSRLVVGDSVSFKIIAKDGLGKRRLLGGDSIRLWMVSDNGMAISSDVTDNKDGSYLAKTLLPWSGRVSIKATVAHTRELFRTILYVQRIYKTTKSFTGNFGSSSATEATPCSPFPVLPGFSSKEICNLTDKNGGYPWYCGKPVKSNVLNCEHYASVRNIKIPADFALTKAEQELITLTETKRPFRIPNNIYLNVHPNGNETVLPLPKQTCYERKNSESLKDTDISGFYYNDNTWRPLSCRLPKIDTAFIRKCFVNTTVLLIGDSQTRQQYDILTGITKCTEIIKRAKVAWHAPLRCDLDQQSTTIRYYPPYFPFYGSSGEKLKMPSMASEMKMLDSIPQSGKYIVVLHHFLHLVPFHLSYLQQRLYMLRDSIVRLLARNKHVDIILHSPFTSLENDFKNKFKVNAFALEMQRKIFTGLGDRFFFLNVWPMTVAKENKHDHPSLNIRTRFMETYIGHICPN